MLTSAGGVLEMCWNSTTPTCSNVRSIQHDPNTTPARSTGTPQRSQRRFHSCTRDPGRRVRFAARALLACELQHRGAGATRTMSADDDAARRAAELEALEAIYEGGVVVG